MKTNSVLIAGCDMPVFFHCWICVGRNTVPSGETGLPSLARAEFFREALVKNASRKNMCEGLNESDYIHSSEKTAIYF